MPIAVTSWGELKKALQEMLNHRTEFVKEALLEELDTIGKGMAEDARRRAPMRKARDKRWGKTTLSTKNQKEYESDLSTKSKAAYESYVADLKPPARAKYLKKYGTLYVPQQTYARTRRANNRRLSSSSSKRVFSASGNQTKTWGNEAPEFRHKRTITTGVFPVTRKGAEFKARGLQNKGYGARARYDIVHGRGMTPGRDTGTLSGKLVYGGGLKRSIDYDVGSSGNKITLALSAGVPYAKYVEYGTRFMGAQPFLMPAFKKGEIKVKALLGRNKG